MSYLKELTANKFKKLVWFIYDVQLHLQEEGGGKALAVGDVYLKLESDRDSDDDDENLPLIWFSFCADVEHSRDKKCVVNIEPVQIDEYSANAMSFCVDDHHIHEQLLETACSLLNWQEVIVKAIRERY